MPLLHRLAGQAAPAPWIAQYCRGQGTQRHSQERPAESHTTIVMISNLTCSTRYTGKLLFVNLPSALTFISRSTLCACSKKYEADWKSKDQRTQQIATALYFIDILALRAGHEKDEDEADTVGCCNLKVKGFWPVPARRGRSTHMCHALRSWAIALGPSRRLHLASTTLVTAGVGGS